MTISIANSSLLATLFREQKEQVDHFFSHIDITEVEKQLELLVSCNGTLFFCGVGKSGIIAEKLAVTMMSTGTRALSLPPTNALHGDLGVVGAGDIVIFISKSGQSEELLNLVPYVRNKGAYPICWVCNSGSRLELACELTVKLPIERELCPFNLAPTTSTAVQLIFGDILAVALMRAKNFTLSEYALNHPAGQIGKRMTTRVSDLMLTGAAVPICHPSDVLVDMLVELSNKRCGCLLVVESGKMVGIFTDGDLRRALQAHGADALQLTLGELMIAPFKSISSDALAVDAMRLMEANQKSPIMVLPVLEQGRVVGLIKMHDLIQAGV